ncbi:hypothetical protein ACWCRF_21980 [Streptomyces sp. NPDC002405]
MAELLSLSHDDRRPAPKSSLLGVRVPRGRLVEVGQATGLLEGERARADA